MPRIPRPSPRLGDLERAVMDVLWTAPEGEEQWWTVRDVHANLAEDRDIAYTTVMTVLDRLAKKSVVLQHKEGRAYRYRAAASQGAMTAELIRDSLSELKQGTRESALVAFVEEASEDDIAALKQALADLTDR
ncbi:putative transcriptional regulator [Nocardioides daedukensis]|uniref:Putative transcriptional regulator n=1 Tax=Nocardioides daedukensis TaxID=634462 RepID=A0A7Y9UPB6_9ACTN|nr:BlaI/MecI/CopY family transcriptional regulator [Nocardioides daedukensis]NYG57326.1 putative transcriptional regulator [Nocardioides daedukensis]